MLVDLNVPWPQKSYDLKPSPTEIDEVKLILTTLHTLGYTHVVLNFTVPHTTKFPKVKTEINPIDLDTFKDVISSTNLKLYTRLTIIVDDPSKGQSLNNIAPQFDIVAAMPISERGLTLATVNLDIDMLTFQYSQRLPVFLKHKNICRCVKNGVKIELVYATALRDINSRKQFIINCKNVIRASRSRGIVISSGATSLLECRNLLAVTSLINFIGLKQDRCNKAMTELAALVLLNGRLRSRSYKQTIVVGSGEGTDVVDDQSVSNCSLIKTVKRRRDSNGTTQPIAGVSTPHTDIPKKLKPSA